MKSSRWIHSSVDRFWSVMLRLAFVAMFVSLSIDSARASENVQIYAHPNVQDQYLTRSVLRSVFTSRVRTWPNGNPVRVFVLADDNPLHIQFCQKYLGTYPYVLRKSWSRTKFTGTGLIPIQVNSLDEMRRLVDSTPGAIGYVLSGRDGAVISPSVMLIQRNTQS